MLCHLLINHGNRKMISTNAFSPQDVILLSDATKKPSRQTKDEFKKMISVPLKPAPLR
jgi:hypothetical protein